MLDDCNGNWQVYLERIYRVFRADFCGAPFTFDGKRVALKRYPIEAEKEATFWHFISEGPVEAERLPNMRRCERISWPKAVMLNVNDAAVRRWVEKRGTEDRIHLWCVPADYIVVLADRGSFVLPWTGFALEFQHERRKFEARWMAAQKASPAAQRATGP
jgi:hypothetical protein